MEISNHFLFRSFKTLNFCLTVFTFLFSSKLISQDFDLQGHRGARGVMPENSIPGFIYALDQNVTTLELDVVITKDKRVIVSHEPWMSHTICSKPLGEQIKESEEKELNIYQLTYEEILNYDCGSKGNSRFPDQVKMKTTKPLLSDLIKIAERHMKGVTLREANYNIEIKSTPEGDNIFHPDVKEFSDLVFKVINDYLPIERVTIQSFDFRVLKYWKSNYPKVKLVALVENLRSIKENINDLGFTPAVYSPYFKLLTKKKVDEIHDIGMKVIPWTVNDSADMRKMISIGVDGLITDYPNTYNRLFPNEDNE